jgi:GT2 family glycosyltransferase
MASNSDTKSASASYPPVPTSYPPVPTSYPPVPTSYPPVPTSYPPVPTSYPPVPTSYPPVPTSYPPVPTSYPPVPPLSATKHQSDSSVPHFDVEHTWKMDVWSHEGSQPDAARAIKLSVVVVARNEVAHLRRTLECLIKGAPGDTEFIVVDDGSEDGTADSISDLKNIRLIRSSGLGVARARNLGWRESKGEIIVISDAHMEAPENWWEPLAAALQNSSVGMVAPAIYAIGRRDCLGYGLHIEDYSLRLRWLSKRHAIPYSVPVVSTCFVAFRREVLEKISGFDEGLDTWGHTDLETSLRIWLFGWKVGVVPELKIGHLFRPKHPYPVQWRSVLYNALRVAFVHFSPERLERVVEVASTHPCFPPELAKVVARDCALRRDDLARRRTHSDSWFFQRFQPNSEIF